MSRSIANEIEDHKKRLMVSRNNLRWIKKIARRFWLLEHVFRRRPIRIYDWTSFDPDPEHGYDGKTGYLDIQIELPPLPTDIISSIKGIWSWIREFHTFPNLRDYLPWFHCRWVFTVLNKHALLSEMSPEDAYSRLYLGKEELHTTKFLLESDPAVFHPKLCANIGTWLESGPIIEFDNIYTGQESFVEDDVAKYAKLWLERWYPGLSNRPIEWKLMD